MEGGLMSGAICTVLLALVYLSVKHTIADFFLQTRYQFANKGTYGHPGGILHSSIHVLLTIPVFTIMPASTLLFGACMLAGEFVIHYHLDWSKEQIVKRYGLGHTDNWFWYLFGLDQFGHTLTYILIVAILVQ